MREPSAVLPVGAEFSVYVFVDQVESFTENISGLKRVVRGSAEDRMFVKNKSFTRMFLISKSGICSKK